MSTADPIANPFPVAAVVFPSASNASVLSRTSGSKCACSAIPPALSATGPYASVARVMPRVDSMPTAARPIPYKPASSLAKNIPTTIASAGITVLYNPTDIPAMIVDGCPVSDCWAIHFTGLNSQDPILSPS